MTLGGGLKKLKSRGKINNVFNKGKMFGFGSLVIYYHYPESEKKKMYLGVGVSKKCLLKPFCAIELKDKLEL